jgi:predicted dehydrogenase
MFVKRILIVGLGSIGRRHLSNIRKLYPFMKIAILRHGKGIEEDDSDLGVEFCTTSLEQVILFRPQAAIIANPATKHLDIAIKLAENGVHIFVEKPISESSNRVSKLIKICIKKNIVLMTAYNLRFLPSLIEFRRLINNNKMGSIYSIHAQVGQHLSEWRKDVDYRKTVSANKKLGGGILLELSHEIDYLNWIFGSIKWVKSHVAKLSNLEIDVEDIAIAILGYEDSLGQENTVLLNMDFFRQDPIRKCTIVGELGTLKWNGISGEVSYYSNDIKNWTVLFSSKTNKNFTYIEEIKHYFNSIKEGKTPSITGEDGLKAVLGVEAIQQSNIEGGIAYL